MRNMVVDFDNYDTYSFKIHYDNDKRTTRIRSFGRVCEACVTDKNNIHIAGINEIIPGSEFRRKWHIYMNLNAESKEQSSLYVCAKHYMRDPLNSGQYNLMVPQPLMKCQAQVTVLSKLYKNKPQTALPILSSLETFTQLHQFYLHEPALCYHGQCDVCHTTQTRLFIVKYEIDATTL